MLGLRFWEIRKKVIDTFELTEDEEKYLITLKVKFWEQYLVKENFATKICSLSSANKTIVNCCCEEIRVSLYRYRLVDSTLNRFYKNYFSKNLKKR